MDLVATASGDLAYASVDFASSSATSSQEREEEVSAVLNASLLRLWPDDREVVEDLRADAVPFELMPLGSAGQPRGPQFLWHDARTSHASWSLWTYSTGAPLLLVVRTDDLRDRTWPYASEHYATTPEQAGAAMAAQGFSCEEQGCYRDDGEAGEMRASFSVHDGHIVSTDLVIRTGRQNGATVPDLAGRWLAQGPPLLTPGVRQAVARRIALCRADAQDWHGVVAGAPLDIAVSDGRASTLQGDRSLEVGATIGTPLVQMFIPER